MWVIITSGPEWAINRLAKLTGYFLTFFDQMGEPHWYAEKDFTYRPA